MRPRLAFLVLLLPLLLLGGMASAVPFLETEVVCEEDDEESLPPSRQVAQRAAGRPLRARADRTSTPRQAAARAHVSRPLRC